MSNKTISSSVLDQEIDHMIVLCSHISQMASRIRLKQLSNISMSSKYMKLSCPELFSMAEHIEGSAILLEALLAAENRNNAPMQTNTSRYYYTRTELIKLRQGVTPTLSIQIKNLLNEAIERECNDSKKLGINFYKSTRAILS